MTMNATKLPSGIRRLKIKTVGIYFLLLEGEVVYIGKSKQLHMRVHEHRKKFAYDEYAFLNVDKEKLDFTEKKYILRYKPKHNKKLLMREVGSRLWHQKRMRIKSMLESGYTYTQIAKSLGLSRAAVLNFYKTVHSFGVHQIVSKKEKANGKETG